VTDEQTSKGHDASFEIPPDRLVDIILSRAKLDEVAEDLAGIASEVAINETLTHVPDDEVSAAFRERAERVADSFLEEARNAEDTADVGFLTRHQTRWREPLLIAQVFLEHSIGLGHVINSAERPRAVEAENAKFEALIRNHARVCRIGKEALCLAASGFASGALARWRTMHEIAAVCLFLRQHSEEVSRRYLL